MEELIAQLIIAACIAKQEELAIYIAFDYTYNKKFDMHNEDTKPTTYILDPYDDIITKLMCHYQLPDFDLSEFELVGGMHLSKTNPAIEMLKNVN